MSSHSSLQHPGIKPASLGRSPAWQAGSLWKAPSGYVDFHTVEGSLETKNWVQVVNLGGRLKKQCERLGVSVRKEGPSAKEQVTALGGKGSGSVEPSRSEETQRQVGPSGSREAQYLSSVKLCSGRQASYPDSARPQIFPLIQIPFCLLIEMLFFFKCMINTSICFE